MSFAETTSRTLPPLSAALGHSSSAIHPGSLQSHLLPTVFLPNYGAAQSLQPHSALPLQHPPATPASYLVTAKPQYQAAAATVAAIPQQTSLQPAQPIPVPVRTTSTILPKIGADYASPPPSLLPSPSIRDFPDPRISPTLTSVSSNLSGSPPSHSYYPQPSSSSEHHGHHHHHHHHHSQPHSPGHHHYGTSPSSHNGGHRAGSVQPSPDEVLAEKRRRNAGASARFRDRRKQREREAQDKCQYLERRVHELEDALAHATGGVLPERERKKRGRASKGGNGMSTNGEHRKESLAGRVSDLENQVVGTRIERESAFVPSSPTTQTSSLEAPSHLPLPNSQICPVHLMTTATVIMTVIMTPTPAPTVIMIPTPARTVPRPITPRPRAALGPHITTRRTDPIQSTFHPRARGSPVVVSHQGLPVR